MIKCLNCNKLLLETDVSRFCEAKCTYKSSKGKSITWAHTLIGRSNDGGTIDYYPDKQYGDDLVNKELTKIGRPSWCPAKGLDAKKGMVSEEQIRGLIASLERDIEYSNQDNIPGVTDKYTLDTIRIQKCKIMTLKWVLGEEIV